MSKMKEPYHRRFSRPMWFRDLPEFPEGRHPLRDLFCDCIIEDIENNLGCGKIDKKDKDCFQNDLRLLAKDYLTFVLVTPTSLTDGPNDISMSKRIKWLQQNVINPTDRLLSALSENNIDHFAEWMDFTNSPHPNKEELVRNLEKLRAYASSVGYDYTEGGRRNAESYNGDFLFDFYSSLTDIVLFYYPKLIIAAGGRESQYDENLASGYVYYLKICRAQIFPEDVNPTTDLIGKLIKAFEKQARPNLG